MILSKENWYAPMEFKEFLQASLEDEDRKTPFIKLLMLIPSKSLPSRSITKSPIGIKANVMMTKDGSGPIQKSTRGAFYLPESYAYMPNAFQSQAIMLPHAFQTMTIQDPAWNMDTGASSHFADNTVCKFTRDNDVFVEFDAYGFSVKDYQTGRLLLCYDSTGDLYAVTQQPSSQNPVVLLSFSSTTWHRRLSHPRDDVLRRLESKKIISCRKSKLSALCHACQPGKPAKLSFYNSESFVDSVVTMVVNMTTPESMTFFAKMAYNFGFLALVLRNRMANPSVCLYMRDPRDPYFTALKPILCYVRGTLDYGLQLHVSSTTQLSAYTNADWAGYPVTNRSTSGYCVFFKDNLLSWSVKHQVTLSRSSVEAQYRVYRDNVSAVYTSANPVQHQRMKHIEIDIHFVHDFIASGQVRVLHVPSRFQYADIFTKGLPTALFIEFRSSLNVRRSPAHTEGEY
nr:ribonuclease H-like domain-containing protein [Tanacetum cinerariifolium]